MKRVFAVGMFALSIALVGCGGSSGPTNVMENADQAAVQSFEEMVAAETAMMSEEPDDATEDTAAPAATPTDE